MEKNENLPFLQTDEPENEDLLLPPPSPQDLEQVEGVLIQVLNRTKEHLDTRYVTAGQEVLVSLTFKVPSRLYQQYKTLCNKVWKIEQAYLVRFFLQMIVKLLQSPSPALLRILLEMKKDAELRTLRAKQKRNKGAFAVAKGDLDTSAAA